MHLLAELEGAEGNEDDHQLTAEDVEGYIAEHNWADPAAMHEFGMRLRFFVDRALGVLG